MEVSVVKIGNSKGIRLSKSLLEEYQIGEAVELVLKPNHIEIRPKKGVRENWETQLSEMISDENEEPMIPDIFEDEEL